MMASTCRSALLLLLAVFSTAASAQVARQRLEPGVVKEPAHLPKANVLDMLSQSKKGNARGPGIQQRSKDNQQPQLDSLQSRGSHNVLQQQLPNNKQLRQRANSNQDQQRQQQPQLGNRAAPAAPAPHNAQDLGHHHQQPQEQRLQGNAAAGQATGGSRVVDQQQEQEQQQQDSQGAQLQQQRKAAREAAAAAAASRMEQSQQQKQLRDAAQQSQQQKQLRDAAQQSQQQKQLRDAAQQSAFREQELLRQKQQERVRQQQDAIRNQMEEQEKYQKKVVEQQRQQHREHLKQMEQRQQSQREAKSANNINDRIDTDVNKNNNMLNSNSNDNLLPEIARAADGPIRRPESGIRVVPPKKEQQQQQQMEVGGAGAAIGRDEHPDPDANESHRPAPSETSSSNNNNNNNNNNEADSAKNTEKKRERESQDDVPDAISQNDGNTNNNNNENSVNNNNDPNGMSDDFHRGMANKAGEDEGNLNNVPIQRNAFPPEQPVRRLGDMHINWDWDDFSLTFLNYGAAEMKVRRAPHATTGEPWPLPQYYTKKEKNILVVDPDFEFLVSGNITCDILDQAVDRYRERIVKDAMEDMYDNLQNAEGTTLESPEVKYSAPHFRKATVINKFSLKIRKPCSLFPTMESDESYDLVVKKSAAYLWANEVWGLLRGLETLSQLIWRGPDERLYVKESVISDYPRFPHRGILFDSSRHFIFKEVIFEMMDAMEMNKMNVMHWHIVDDQSFPYDSQVFPDLSAKGAYHPTFVYSLEDIAEIIDYGRMRGIRVLPEFDSPGHTYSWGLSRPELLTQCYSGSSPVKGYLGPINPSQNSTYRFLKTLFGEILRVFKDDFVHLGGDEVPLGCWQSNPDVTKFGDRLGQQSGQSSTNQQAYFGGPSPNIRLVYEYYVNRLMKDIKDLGKQRQGIKFIMWQEVMNNDLKLPNDTLIQVWMGDMADVSRAISLGYNVLYSSCWYLDHVEYGVKWPKYYQCDPADTSYGYSIDEKKVKGGEACLWSEYIDNENLMQTTWPRTSAIAERLWSSKDTRNLDMAGERLSEHRCRMLRRGLRVAQISGPDYCLKRGVRRGGKKGPGCQGDGCKPGDQGAAEGPDIKFRVRTEGGGKSADCTWTQMLYGPTGSKLLQVGGNVTLLSIVAVIAFVVLVSLSRSSGKLYTLRTCRHRTILIVFLAVLVVYFMCYTTMWMHVFEFSGSLHKRIASSSSSSSAASAS